MAKYKKRADGRYCGHVHLGYDDNGNQIFSPMVYAYSIPELDKKLANIKSDANKGIYADDKGKTLKRYAEEWLAAYKSNKENGTYNNYNNIVKNHLDTIGGKRLKDLTKTDIQGQINEKSGHPETQRMIKITINQILESAIEDGLIYKNVSRKVELPKQSKPKKRALYESEKKAISKCNFTLAEKTFIYILLYTGLRRGEVLALTVNDINLKLGSVDVNKSLEWIGNAPNIKKPKSESSYRKVTMPTILGEIFKVYLDEINTIYLFTDSQGELMSESQYRKFWKGIHDKINVKMGGTASKRTRKGTVKGINAIDGLTPHTFRHNYATMLYYAGIDVKEAQRLLGHASVKVTLEIYTHLDEEKSNTADKLNTFIAL